MDSKLQVLLSGLSFPEGPRWYQGKLWFSDFYTQRVQTVDASGKTETKAEVPQRPSGLGFMPDGTLLVVSMLDRCVLRVKNGQNQLHADLSKFAGGPCNDMVVDAKGRAYVGNFGYEKNKGEAQRTTRIVLIEPDGKARPVGEELLFPNGTVISPDGKVLIVGETFANRLTAFDIAANGDLSSRRLFAKISGCTPDGICLDAEGAVWVTDPVGKRVLRVFDGGKVDREISFGAGRGAYACVLGGPDRKTLFVLTNTGSGPAMADKRDGRVEYIRVDIAGAGIP